MRVSEKASSESTLWPIVRAAAALIVRGAPVDEVRQTLRDHGLPELAIGPTQSMISQGCVAARSVLFDGASVEERRDALVATGMDSGLVGPLLDICLASVSLFDEDGPMVFSGESRAIARRDPPGWSDPVPNGLLLNFDTPESALRSIEYAYRARSFQGVLACKDFQLEAQFIANPYLDKLGELEYKKLRGLHVNLFRQYFEMLLREGIPEWGSVETTIYAKRRLSATMYVISQEIRQPGHDCVEQRTFVGRGREGWKTLMPYSPDMERLWLDGIDAAWSYRRRRDGDRDFEAAQSRRG